MAKINNIVKEVLDKTEMLVIGTCGADGVHLSATWGEYVKNIGLIDDEIILIPSGGLSKTEENLKLKNNIEVLIGSKQVQSAHGAGQGISIFGKGEFVYSGEIFDRVKSKYSWIRAVLMIKIESFSTQL
ncbi:MAG: pyridoxamine 5'-phosphate oxidase family protein [Candidatus Acididesulfobacter guangdongensis]|uniref:Pyridoxamine 5'-phosphate oxidase family protein n=1 Tax=Acididesulfobacter guangdongensis TaxID=2597225 RepID=A0A519BFM4_ACIG2|nr:MAG: pyridoxamine 5'-phosphate oxidase family protein [Candidatus Acididesulfobacter guangdongensis]